MIFILKFNGPDFNIIFILKKYHLKYESLNLKSNGANKDKHYVCPYRTNTKFVFFTPRRLRRIIMVIECCIQQSYFPVFFCFVFLLHCSLDPIQIIRSNSQYNFFKKNNKSKKNAGKTWDIGCTASNGPDATWSLLLFPGTGGNLV